MDRERIEVLLDAISTWDPELIGEPRDRDEIYLKAIAGKDPSIIGYPRDRTELFIKAIAEAIPAGDPEEDLTGLTTLFSQENIQFDGTAANCINTGVYLMSSANIGKDFKIICKNIRFLQGTQNTDVTLSLKYNVGPDYPGIMVNCAYGGTLSSNSTTIKVGTGAYFDRFIIGRTNGEYYCHVSITAAYHISSISIPDFNAPLENSQPLILGGIRNSLNQIVSCCKSSIGSIVVAMAE